MTKIKVDKVSKIAIAECMENLSRYVNTLDMKTDITLYLNFESIINALFEDQIDNSNIFFKDKRNNEEEHPRLKYKLDNYELIIKE